VRSGVKVLRNTGIENRRNTMKRITTFAALALFLGLGLPGMSAYAADKPIVMELSSFMTTSDKLSVMLQEFCNEVGKRTNGRVRINYHPGGTLTPPAQTFDSVQNEIIDMGYGPMGVTTGRFPLMEVMDLPLGIKSANAASRLSTELVKKFKPKELAKVKVLWMLSSPPANLQTKKPVRTLQELKGLKLRSLGGTTTKYIEALGAVPVMIAPTDVYDALSKGVADGAVVISDALTTLKWGDILKYTAVMGQNSFSNNGYFVMNLNRWNSLPPDIQQIIDKMSEEYLDKMSKLWDQKEKDAIATLKAQGQTMVTLTAQEEEKWAKQLETLDDQYVKEKTAKGIPAAEVLQYCRDWVKKNQK
jgi:TRAP-type transport system periplasmic protein